MMIGFFLLVGNGARGWTSSHVFLLWFWRTYERFDSRVVSVSLVNAIEEDEEKGQWSVVGSEQKAELLDWTRSHGCMSGCWMTGIAIRVPAVDKWLKNCISACPLIGIQAKTGFGMIGYSNCGLFRLIVINTAFPFTSHAIFVVFLIMKVDWPFRSVVTSTQSGDHSIPSCHHAN